MHSIIIKPRATLVLLFHHNGYFGYLWLYKYKLIDVKLCVLHSDQTKQTKTGSSHPNALHYILLKISFFTFHGSLEPWSQKSFLYYLIFTFTQPWHNLVQENIMVEHCVVTIFTFIDVTACKQTTTINSQEALPNYSEAIRNQSSTA